MSSSRHRPWFRRILLAANAAFPPVMLGLLSTGDRQWPAAMLATAVVHALLLWAILQPRCAWLGPVVSRFRTAENTVWLTIDDGPDTGTAQLATRLRERGVRATFFLIGERISAHPEALRALADTGHSVANHSATHPRKTFWCLGRSRVASEVDGCAGLIPQAHGFFRGPVGHKSPALHPVLAKRGMQFIAWTSGGSDGWSTDPTRTVARILAEARPGAIILLHECRAHSHATILAVVDALIASGFTFVIPDAPLSA